MFNCMRRHLVLKLALAAMTITLMLGLVISGPNCQSVDAKQRLSFITAPPTSVLNDHSLDGSQFVQSMADAANALKSYSFQYDTTVYKGSKTIAQRGQFYFKQPRLIRVEMTGSYKHGSVAVLGKDGKVRGHMGGALSAFTVTLDPRSDQLQGANGYPLIDSDFASMARVVKGFLNDGCTARVTDQPLSIDGQPKKVYVLEIYKGPGNTELYKRTYVDAQSMLPLVWFDYKDGQLFARTIWSNLNIATIADDQFKL